MKIKHLTTYFAPIFFSGVLLISVVGCTDKLDLPFEDVAFTSDVDYTKGQDMIFPLLGAYEGL